MRLSLTRTLLLVWIGSALAGSGSVDAAFEQWGTGADTRGMATIGVSLPDPLFIPFVNSAVPFRASGWRLSTAYSRRFGMEELTCAVFSLSGKYQDFLFSAGAERFGYDLYGEEQVVLGFGFPAAAATRLGVTTRIHRLRIDGYGSAWAPGFDWGWYSEPAERLRIGAVWRNINRPDLGRSGVKLPSGLIFGISGTFSERMTYTVEGRKVRAGEVESGFGFAFLVSRELTLRVGYRRETGEYSLGTTLRLPYFRWDYTLSAHTVLGMTHFFTLSAGSRAAPGSAP